MKKALVLGATGGMGNAIVEELHARGITVVAFARTKERLSKLFGSKENVIQFPGDVFNKNDLIRAAEGVDVIFHSVNIPYSEWAEKQPRLMKNVVEAAENIGAKLAVVDNIYLYGRSNGEMVTEMTKKIPHTKKGKIRLELEVIAKSANVPVLVAHFPDFYGPNVENSLLGYTFENMIQNKKAMYVGKQHIQREFIYTPDGAKAIVELALRQDTFGHSWNIPGSGVISGEEIINIAKEHLSYTKSVSTVSKSMIRLIGLFDKQMREYVEMFYLNEEPVILSGQKYQKIIGQVPMTSYKDGIKNTLQAMANNR